MTELAREYGEGLYDLAKEEKLTDQLLEELKVLNGCFSEDPDFLRLLSNRALGLQERHGIMDAALKEQIHPYLLNFLKLLCDRDALHEFGGCAEVYTEHYNLDNRVAVAVATTAAPLTEEQQRRLADKLSEMTGCRVQLEQKLDPSVLGGVLLEMDGKRWDNTVRSRLDSIRRVIAGA